MIMDWQYAIVAAIGAAVAAIVIRNVLRFAKRAKNPCSGCDCCANGRCDSPAGSEKCRH